METIPGESSGRPHQKHRYDTELIHRESERLVSAYLGDAGRESGSRRLWTCPKCNKPKKLSLQYSSGSVGCLNAGCEVPTATDVIKFIGHLEGLENRGRDFVKICELSYELLGIETPSKATTPTNTSESTDEVAPRSTGSKSRPSVPQGWKTPQQHQPVRQRLRQQVTTAPTGLVDLVDEVFSLLLKNCPPEDRDFDFWDSRGVDEKTVIEGRFGSMSPDRCAYALSKLESAFGRDRLLGVPGFREDGRGRLGFTLWGDFTLIPYFDGEGRVRTIEGRAIGEPPSWGAKYTSPRGGGNHLYVFPSFVPEELVAFCEGPVGAILAAQHGIPVGSIQGVKRYRTAGAEAPLPELIGVDFKGQSVSYIPDLDVKPAAIKDVAEHLPRACDYLIAHQNGKPVVVSLPEGKDLDEYLIALSPDQRKSAFDELLRAAVSPEDWSGASSASVGTLDNTDENPVAEEPDKVDVGQTNGEAADPKASEEPTASAENEGPAADQDDANREVEESPDDDPESLDTDRPSREQDSTNHRAEAQEQGEHEVYDRWYLGVSSPKTTGERETLRNSIPYRPRQAEPVVPTAALATSHELVRAALGGLVGTIVSWFLITLWTGSDLRMFGLLPAPPNLVFVAGGLLGALIGGAVCVVVVFAILAGRRRALRRHMRGDDVK